MYGEKELAVTDSAANRIISRESFLALIACWARKSPKGVGGGMGHLWERLLCRQAWAGKSEACLSPVKTEWSRPNGIVNDSTNGI